MTTLSEPKEIKSRKEHRCDFCSEKIIVGQKYTKSSYANDGSVYHWKVHNYCDKLSHTLKMYEDFNEGVTMDDFMENVSEAHQEILTSIIPTEDINKFSDITSQLTKVRFKDKLWFVIRHFNKLEKELK